MSFFKEDDINDPIEKSVQGKKQAGDKFILSSYCTGKIYTNSNILQISCKILLTYNN